MIYNVAIIDNLPSALTKTKNALHKRPIDDIASIKTANSYETAWCLLLQHHQDLDIIFLDLDLNDDEEGIRNDNEFPSGLQLILDFDNYMKKKDPYYEIEFAVVLVSHYEKLGVAVTTLMRDYECFVSLVSKSYYLKQTFEEQLDQAFEIILDHLILTRPLLTHVPSAEKKPLIFTKDVLYIEALNKCSNLFLKDGRNILSNKGLKNFESSRYKTLYRCGKQFIVNLKEVIEVDPKGYGFNSVSCTLRNGKKLKVSRGKKNELLVLCKMVGNQILEKKS